MRSADSERKYKARRKRGNEFARLKRLKQSFAGTGMVKLGDYKTRRNPKSKKANQVKKKAELVTCDSEENNTEVMAASALDNHGEKAKEPQERLDSIERLFVDENIVVLSEEGNYRMNLYKVSEGRYGDISPPRKERQWGKSGNTVGWKNRGEKG